MIRCTRCGLEAHVVAYGDGYTTAIQVTCRVCRVCRRWAWGAPTACDACAAFEAGKERAVSAEAERDEARAELVRLAAVDWLARQEDSDD